MTMTDNTGNQDKIHLENDTGSQPEPPPIEDGDMDSLSASHLVGLADDTIADKAAMALPNESMAEGEIVARLAALPPLEYAQRRKTEAKKLDINVGDLDRCVRTGQREANIESGIDFAEVEQWPEAVDGAGLLDALTATIRRFIVSPPETARAAALWVVMTWLMDEFQTAPLAIITAPEMRCGKSLLLEIIGKLLFRSLAASSISSSAIYRVIEAHHPSLIIDEADAFMKENEELRGIVNSGHQRANAYVIRCVGDDHNLKRFSTWGAKAIAGIGKLAATLMDRAILLNLRRKLPSEQVERLRYAEPDLFSTLNSKLERWTNDNREAIRLARPIIPSTLNDRAQDNWEPLLAIADTAGGNWPKLARQTAVTLSAKDDTVSAGIELLTDIQAVFDRVGGRVSSVDLISNLCQDDEAPWAAWNRGQGITPRQLTGRLNEYGIASKNIRVGDKVFKGFERTQFEDAFKRYISSPSKKSATTLQCGENNDNTDSYLCSATKHVAATIVPNTLHAVPECMPVAVTGENVADSFLPGATRQCIENANKNIKCSIVADFSRGYKGNEKGEGLLRMEI